MERNDDDNVNANPADKNDEDTEYGEMKYQLRCRLKIIHAGMVVTKATISHTHAR